MSQEIIEKIKTAYKKEQGNRRKAIIPSDIPSSYEDITLEWLTAILCDTCPGAKVTSFHLGPADDGSSNRRRIFLVYNDAGKKAGLPDSLFCKASHNLINRILLGLSGAAIGEMTFYNKIRPLLTIESPQCYFATYDPESRNSIIMLGDLGKNAEMGDITTDMTKQRLESQMRLLAAYHGRFYESPELSTTLSALPTWVEFFKNTESLNMAQACDNGFIDAVEVLPPRLYARHKDVWPATVKSVERHLSLPHTLNHGDTHIRNWYISPNGEMGLCDWQTSCRGHWSRDLAYALSTSMTVEQRRLWESDLIQYYFDQLQQVTGRNLPFDGVFDLYRQQLMSALAWWTNTLMPSAEMSDMQPRNVSLEIIKRIGVAVDDLDSLDCV